MAGFFRKIVDKISGYPEDSDYEYENEYGYDEGTQDQYGYSQQEPVYSQQQPPMQDSRFAAPQSFQPEAKATYSAPLRSQPTPKVVPIKTTMPGEQQLVILQPNNIQSAQRVCDHLRAGHTVICNIENVDAKVAQRVIDFISGSTYAMDGNVKPIDARAHSFVAVPRSVSLVDRELAPQETEDFAEPFRMAR